MLSAILRIGDRVQWRGNFGTSIAVPATVVAIDRTDGVDKHGDPVDEIPWSEIRSAVVDLANGRWAYGSQIAPLEREGRPIGEEIP